LIVQATVGRERCWLTGQSGAPPESSVNFSHGAFGFSRERRVHRQDLGAGADDSPDSPVIYNHVAAQIPEISYFAAGPA
jgi:hypothetical protein